MTWEGVVLPLALSMVLAHPIRAARRIAAIPGGEDLFVRGAFGELVRAGGLFERERERLKEHDALDAARREEDEARRLGLLLLIHGASDYPPALLELSDPPLVLRSRGLPAPGRERAVAIVGARAASTYGTWVAGEVAATLAAEGITVVSGLARGIDTRAHRGALSAGGRTVGVLGSGFRRLYPPENEPLVEAMCGAGQVLSEFPLDAPPLARHFPFRNRVIAALSDAVVVVEARMKSGSLGTADWAADLGRMVLAVPGRIDSELSAGPLALIRDGAVAVTAPTDVAREVFGIEGSRRAAPPAPPQTLGTEENRLMALLTNEPCPLDRIVELAGLPAGRVISTLLSLVLRGAVAEHPGMCYARAPEAATLRTGVGRPGGTP